VSGTRQRGMAGRTEQRRRTGRTERGRHAAKHRESIVPDGAGLGVILRQRGATRPARPRSLLTVTNAGCSHSEHLWTFRAIPYMKQLHNALCHPAAIVPRAVETSHYKSHIQAPFYTYGTPAMLASVGPAAAYPLARGSRNAKSLDTGSPTAWSGAWTWMRTYKGEIQNHD